MLSWNPSYQNTRSLIKQGTPIWAQWTYDPKEHSRFAQRDLDRIRKSIRGQLFVIWGIAAVPGLLGFILVLANKGGGLGWDLLLIVGVVLLVTGINNLWSYSNAQQLYEWRQKGPHEVTITPIEVHEATVDVALVAPSRSLIRVYIHNQDSTVLRFRVQDGRGGLSAVALWPLPTGEMWVLIPEGHEAEARDLAARFQREVVRTQ